MRSLAADLWTIWRYTLGRNSKCYNSLGVMKNKTLKLWFLIALKGSRGITGAIFYVKIIYPRNRLSEITPKVLFYFIFYKYVIR